MPTPISRSTHLPPYCDYLTHYALAPATSPPSADLTSLAYGDFYWVEIPSYQRGISWDISNIEEFINSDSVVLGNVIFGSFPVSSRFAPHIPNATTSLTLVDGLQRLALGTMILNSLHLLVLASAPTRPVDAQSFIPLQARVLSFAAIYQHNDREFRNHPRRAIADQYAQLAARVEDYIEEALDQSGANRLANNIIRTMLGKQIAIDIYANIASQQDIMNTFIGINTVRVDLGPVDLLRSYIVEAATDGDWSNASIEDMENEFTEIFTKDEKPNSELLPFVAVLLNALRSSTQAARVFPSWNSGLTKVEVDNFLEFVRKFQACSGINGYFDEIRDCGAIPYATLMAYYYCESVHNGKPDPTFLSKGTNENAELHQFLLANYRVFLDGRIGRTRTYTEQVFSGTIQSLIDAANVLSDQYIGRNISKPVDLDWLKASLNKIDRNRAKRVFNAMLLPKRNQTWGSGQFNPLEFGRKSVQFQVDHLIPASMKLENQPGAREVDTLRNFAPLRTNQNRLARASNCSSKLGPNGLYFTELQSQPNYHQYCDWLVNQHIPGLQSIADADQQMYLEPNQNPSIGDERIEFIAAELHDRL